jgi:phosphatidylglycerol:prolipoprotein diacylglycerol transferase
MYPTLRYALYDMTGIDLPVLALAQSDGLFFLAAFLIGGWLLYAELKRRADAGLLIGIETTTRFGGPLDPLELILHPLLGAAVGYKLVDALLHPALYTGPAASKIIFSLSHGSLWGALLVGLAFLGWKIWEKRKELEKYPNPEEISYHLLPHDRVGDIITITLISGILGGKLFHLFEFASWGTLSDELFSSAINVYGGLIAAPIALIIWAQRKEISALQLFDSAAPILLLSYAIGRLGAHFSGNGDWGSVNSKSSSWLPDWIWAYDYPNNSINAGIPMKNCNYPVAFGDYCYQLPEAVYPIAVWEFLIAFIGFSILWNLRKKITIQGLLYAIYLIFNGLFLLLIEMMRVPSDYKMLGIQATQAQAFAVLLVVLGIVGAFVLLRKHLSSSTKSPT